VLNFKTPLNDMRFVMNEVFDYPAHYRGLQGMEEATPELVDAILQAAATYSEDALAPLYQSGDQEGCRFEDGVVLTPKGYKEAYRQFIQGGWQGLSYPAQYGGQGLPMSLNLIKSEIMGTANWAFNMYPGLSIGCINTIMQYGDETTRLRYLPKLVSGEWTGTMCLTEPQCGSDLAQVKTRAQPTADGQFALSGTKIFISSGEHDLTDNIVHIVLARLPDAPAGTRGISLFIVPKHQVLADGSLGPRNAVHCGSIEHKMGIHASATAVLNFDGAQATLIGEPHKGLEAMFTFMNTARIGTAIQGVAHAERSFQGALAYALERRSMRALSGKKEPDQVADLIAWHPDVRRMLLTQKAIAEGGRAMIYGATQWADRMYAAAWAGDTAAYKRCDGELGFYTPILKGFLTELGMEAANLGMQVYGGHGYIQEHGMEQIARDARIATLYEGTTGIQALDLLGRKVMLQSRGRCVREYTLRMFKWAKSHWLTGGSSGRMARSLAWRALQWNVLTLRLMVKAKSDPEQVGAASFDYLMYSGHVMMAHHWALMAERAQAALHSGQGDQSADFYQAKIHTAEFYFERMLPRADAHARMALSPARHLLDLPAASLSGQA
jgi:alkylation response protein AidB-like acyl-CoA dehydrogenase